MGLNIRLLCLLLLTLIHNTATQESVNSSDCVNLEIEKSVSILKRRKTVGQANQATNSYIYKLYQPFYERLKTYVPQEYSAKFKDEHDLRVFFPSTL